MARSGRFGRLPRTAPSLASVIVSLAREMAARQDSNIVDAWKNGGEFEGKPVTDQMLLDFLRNRRDSLSESDPLWDYYDNLLLTYGFSIEESKMSLKYAEHKVNEVQMANFYKEWAAKMPKDSEIYRTLMRSAAQFLDTAKARAASGARANKQAAYNSAVMSSYDRYERAYDTVVSALTAAARTKGILGVSSFGTPEDLADLRNGDENDNARFLQLIESFDTDPEFAGLRAQLHEVGIDHLDYGVFLDLSQQKRSGIRSRRDLATQYDDASGRKKAEEELADFNVTANKWQDLDEWRFYSEARSDLDAALSANTINDPYADRAAYENYTKAVSQARSTMVDEIDRGMLANELTALRGEGPEGGTGSEFAGLSDAGAIANDVATYTSMIDSVESGRFLFAMQPVEGGGSAYALVSVTDATAQDPTKGVVLMQTMGRNSVQPIWVPLQPIYAQGGTNIDPRTGRPTAEVTAGNDTLLGYTYSVGNQRLYGIFGSDGQMAWTARNPFRNPPQGGTVNITPSADGALYVQWAIPSNAQFDPTTGQWVGEAPGGFDVTQLLDPSLYDADLRGAQNKTVYDDAMTAFYANSPEARQSLLQANPTQVASVFLLLYGPEQGASAMDRWTEQRNLAARQANYEARRTATPVGREQRYADVYEQRGYEAISNPLRQGPNPDLLPSEARFGTVAAEVTRANEKYYRDRASELVTSTYRQRNPWMVQQQGPNAGQINVPEGLLNPIQSLPLTGPGQTLSSYVRSQTGVDFPIPAIGPAPPPPSSQIKVPNLPTSTPSPVTPQHLPEGPDVGIVTPSVPDVYVPDNIYTPGGNIRPNLPEAP